MRRSWFAWLLPLLLLAAPLLAAPLQAAEPGGEYTLTRQYGSVMFRVMQQDYLTLVGRFDVYSGTLSLDPANLANSQLSATVDLGSLSMADSDVSETLVNSSVWFNSSLYPQATFVSSSAEVQGDNKVDFIGELTFLGISQPWTFSVELFGGSSGELGGSTVGIAGRGVINRLDFGMDQYRNMAADEVEIEVNAKFNRN
ncbi:MAG TPA: YceI family protein [Pseudomonadaceae bacterium]|nr:YceI family protein [Pseudomonadaceae bacterium]